jgi:hypothetical protein
LMRFRATAPPRREATATPNLCPGRPPRWTKMLTPRPETFSPPRMTSRNSFVARMRSALENRCLTYVTASRFRPLARRRAKTRWPPALFIRRRNPWVRFRLMRLG